MRTIFIDIGLTILLASAIIWFQMQPDDSISLKIQLNDGTLYPYRIKLSFYFGMLMSKRVIEIFSLIQRFHQAHPDIQTVFIHDNSTDDDFEEFLVNLGVYSTPAYNESWARPDSNHHTLQWLFSRVDFNHSPHYSTLMEFFEVRILMHQNG